MPLDRLSQITEVGIKSGITLRNINVENAYVSGVITATSLAITGAGISIAGVVTATSFDGNVTGRINPTSLNVSGVSTFNANIFLGDGDIAYFGDGQDLLIFHNSTDSIIRDNGTGDLFIEGGNRIKLTNPTGIETYAVFNQDGASELWYDNVKRLETSGIGVSITSALTVGTGASISSPTANVLTLGTNNIERIRVGAAGSIGIGTDNPLGVLAVSGGVSNPAITFQNGSATNTASDAAVGSIVGYSRTTGGNINIGSVDIRTDTASASSGAVRILTASNGSLAERLRVDSSGRVTIPYQPAFDAVYTSPNGAVGSTTQNTEIVFNVANTNVGSNYSTSTGRFTAPVAGTYFFSMFGMSNVSDTVWYEMRKNGNLITYTHNPYVSFNAGGAFKMSGYSFIITLAVSDYVSVFTGGTTSGMYGGGNNHNGFCGYLIG